VYVAEESETVADAVPLLAAALPLIGHEAIRSRGTIGGSLAHADPAAELPAVARALNAEFVVRGQSGTRVVPAAEWCIASWDAGLGAMTVYAATQSVHITRNGVAARLGIEGDKVRVLAGDIGGSFGLKIGASREELAVAAASRHLGRPVKWVEDRGENLTASGQAREESRYAS
jgi:aerobic carbon-monoxide dehydrogenase large subunit